VVGESQDPGIAFRPEALAESAAMRTAIASALFLVSVAASAAAPMGDPAKVSLKTTPVAGGIFMVEGADGFAGGNVGVSVGDDFFFIIDDELQPMTPKLKVALAALSGKPVRFVINTHWHADHTGGNGGLAAAGAIVVAHDNVRKRLSVDQFMEFMGQKKTIPASPPAALPVVTFGDDLTLHLNGDEVHVFHVPPAHTDGDAIVHFKKANVVHAGDTFVGSYPFVDIGSGGQFEGFITAADRLLAICDDNTKIIPGHGPIMGRADLQAWRDMLVQVRDRVGKLVAAKKTLEQIKAAKPIAEFDAKWGQGFIKADDLLDAVYKTRPPIAEKSTTGKRPKK
jgi:cyclase